MRPKIVILTLIATFSVLGLIAIFKGVGGKNTGSANGGGQSAPAGTTGHAASNGTNDAVGAVGASGNPVAVSPELRAAMITKEQEQISDLQGQVDGTNNLLIITAIIEKLSGPEAEVRQYALDALRQLNDTNAVPGLEKVVETVKDPREKVAVLDTIDYLKMPSATDGVPPEMATNFSTRVSRTSNTTNHQYNPAFSTGKREVKRKSGAQQSSPDNQPANPPQ